MPLGLFFVGDDLTIKPPTTQSSRHILGQNQLVGRSIEDVLFSPGWKKFLPEQMNSIKALLTSMGCSPEKFHEILNNLPQLICHPVAPSDLGGTPSDEGRWIRACYEPTFENKKLAGLLIMIEDRTQFELDRRQRALDQETERRLAFRFLEIYRIPCPLGGWL